MLSSRESEAERRIKKILASEKTISTRDLSRKTRISSPELDRILNALGRLDMVNIQNSSGPSGQPRRIVKWLG